MPDLVDLMNDYSQSKQIAVVRNSIKSVLDDVDNDIKIAVFRDLMLEKIYGLIDRFPEQTQKEMLAIMTDKYLTAWNKN